MNLFEEALKSGYNEIEDIHDDIFESIEDILEETYGDDEITVEMLRGDFGLSDEEAEEVMENIVRRVDAKGNVSRTKSRAVRSRRATATTGMSKTALKLRARKAQRTKKRNPSGLRMAKKRRSKAMRRRKSMGIK